MERPFPHDQCPMAIALKERRAINGQEAAAERPDGTRIPFLAYPTPLFNEGGELVGAVNMLVDISERKSAELASQRLAAIVEILRRCDHLQGYKWHHHELEWRRPASLRL